MGIHKTKITTFDKLALINASLPHSISLKLDTLHYFLDDSCLYLAEKCVLRILSVDSFVLFHYHPLSFSLAVRTSVETPLTRHGLSNR